MTKVSRFEIEKFLRALTKLLHFRFPVALRLVNRVGRSSFTLIILAQYSSILSIENVGLLLVDFVLTLLGILISVKLV